MAFFIIAIIFVIIGIIVLVCIEPEASTTVFVIAFIFVVLGLFADWGGYEEAFVNNEYELIPLIEDTNIYLIQSNDGTKMCKYKIASEHDKKIKNDIIKKIRSSVEVEYIQDSSIPVLREYVSKPKESKWNGICVGAKEYSVLFVPESYIIK